MEHYAPSGKVLWDSWFIQKGGETHAFYLQADPTRDSTKPPEGRGSIGHAMSTNFREWKELPVALVPGETESWDSGDIWSGSAAEKDGLYYLYYTGVSLTEDREYVQRIGVATSHDLVAWEKHPENPLFGACEQYYDTRTECNQLSNRPAWRDPFVFKDLHSEKRYMTISARAKGSQREYNGCVALAESDDMIHWNVLPPIFSPGHYDEIEVTRIIFHKDLYYLFFTTHATGYEPSFAKVNGAHEGLHCYYSDNLFGGYRPVNNDGVVIANGYSIYDIRVLPIKGDDFIGIGWLNRDQEGNFIGKLSEPFTVTIRGDVIVVGE